MYRNVFLLGASNPIYSAGQSKRKADADKDSAVDAKKIKIEEGEGAKMPIFDVREKTGFLALALADLLDGKIERSTLEASKKKLTEVILDADPHSGMSHILEEIIHARTLLAAYPIAREASDKIRELSSSSGRAESMKLIKPDAQVHQKMVNAFVAVTNPTAAQELESYKNIESTLCRLFSGAPRFSGHLDYHSAESHLDMISECLDESSREEQLERKPEREELSRVCRNLTQAFAELETMTRDTNAQALKLRSFMENEMEVHKRFRSALEAFVGIGFEATEPYKLPEGEEFRPCENLCAILRLRIESQKGARDSIGAWLKEEFKSTAKVMIRTMEAYELSRCSCCKDAKSSVIRHIMKDHHPQELFDEKGSRTQAHHLATRFLEAVMIQRNDSESYPDKPWPDESYMTRESSGVDVPPDGVLAPLMRSYTELWKGTFLAYGSWRIKTDDFFCVPQHCSLIQSDKVRTDRRSTECYIPTSSASFHVYLEVKEIMNVTRKLFGSSCIILPKYAYYSPLEMGMAYDISILDAKALGEWPAKKQAIIARECLEMFSSLLESISAFTSIALRLNLTETNSEFVFTDDGLRVIIYDWASAVSTHGDTSDVDIRPESLTHLTRLLSDLLDPESNRVTAFKGIAELYLKLGSEKPVKLSKLKKKTSKAMKELLPSITVLYSPISTLLEDGSGLVQNHEVEGGRQQFSSSMANSNISSICKQISSLKKNAPQHVFFLKHDDGVYYLAFNRAK